VKRLKEQFALGLYTGAFGICAVRSIIEDWMGLDKWQQFEQVHWSTGWMAWVGDLGMLLAFILFWKLSFDARQKKSRQAQ